MRREERGECRGELKAVEGSSLHSPSSARLRPGAGAGANRSTGHRRHRVIAELSLTGRSIDYYFYAPRPAWPRRQVCARASRSAIAALRVLDLIIKASPRRDVPFAVDRFPSPWNVIDNGIIKILSRRKSMRFSDKLFLCNSFSLHQFSRNF